MNAWQQMGYKPCRVSHRWYLVCLVSWSSQSTLTWAQAGLRERSPCCVSTLALRLFEEALSTVPSDLREGGLALGSTKWHMIRTVVLPSALPGLVTGLILTAGKVIGEAAALIFTMGIFNPGNVFTLNPLIASDTLTTRLYYIKGPGAGTLGLTSSHESALAAGIAAVLIVLLLVINIAARGVGRAIQRRVTAA